MVLTRPDGIVAEYALRFKFPATNNEAEYEALISGFKLARDLKVRRLKVFTDFQLVVGQVRGEFEARSPSMIKYLQKAQVLVSSLDDINIQQVPRSENARADLLSRLATAKAAEMIRSTCLEVLMTPSVDEAESIMATDVEPSWMDPLVLYLTEGTLPKDEVEARRLIKRSARYALYEG